MMEIQNIKKMRQALGLTQHQFAKQASVSQSLIAKIESGRVDPAYSKVKQIEEALHLLSAKKELSLDEIMTKKIITVKPSEKAAEVIKLMNRKNISQIPVVERDNIIGVVSESSALAHAERLKNSTVAEIMDEAPPIVPQTTSISVVSSLLKHYSLVLVKEKGTLVGIITKADLLRKAFI
ncbi:CBS domain-containing protein [Candidatus Woesearchaeota archaeon]|nr:CBS domain-containing protein [Candidatus Woesearchaeota archaeon]MBI2582162.1 CBS domain-containing protein [Candidatus Woesearchaeota archaeon]